MIQEIFETEDIFERAGALFVCAGMNQPNAQMTTRGKNSADDERQRRPCPKPRQTAEPPRWKGRR